MSNREKEKKALEKRLKELLAVPEDRQDQERIAVVRQMLKDY